MQWATTYAYDNRGRMNLVTYPDGGSRTPHYDEEGNLTRLLFSDGTDLTFSHDALGRLVTATDADAAHTLMFTYDAEGRPLNPSK